MGRTVPFANFALCILLFGCSRESNYQTPQDERGAAYEALSPGERAAVDAGRLVYSAGLFIPAPTLLPHPDSAALRPSHVQFPGGYWGCPEIPTDPELWTDLIDFGTFYGGAVANKPGERFNMLQATFVLPPTSEIEVETVPDGGYNQAPYAMFGGWSTSASGHNPFDAGLAWQNHDGKDGWYLFAFSGSSGWQDDSDWRLRNIFDDDEAPLTISMTVMIVDDDTFELVAYATDDTEWYNVETGQRSSVRGIEDYTVPGFPADGDDVTLNIQLNFARNRWPPLYGSQVPDMGVFDLSYAMRDPLTGNVTGSTPWDFQDLDQSEFLMVCPLDGIEEAYEFGGGSSASSDFEARFQIAIDIHTSNVHVPCLLPQSPSPWIPMNFGYLIPSVGGQTRTLFYLRNCGRVARSFTIAADDEWAAVYPSTVSVQPNGYQQLSIQSGYYYPSYWFSCPLYPLVDPKETTIRISGDGGELHSFRFIVDCSIPNQDRHSVTIKRVDGVYPNLPPTGNQGTLYNQYYINWMMDQCGQPLTPNIRRLWDSMSAVDIVQYGVFSADTNQFVSGYSSDPLILQDAEVNGYDLEELITWTMETVGWWNEIVDWCVDNGS